MADMSNYRVQGGKETFVDFDAKTGTGTVKGNGNVAPKLFEEVKEDGKVKTADLNEEKEIKEKDSKDKKETLSITNLFESFFKQLEKLLGMLLALLGGGEGNLPVTSDAVGEEGGEEDLPVTSDAVGEEGGEQETVPVTSNKSAEVGEGLETSNRTEEGGEALGNIEDVMVSDRSAEFGGETLGNIEDVMVSDRSAEFGGKIDNIEEYTVLEKYEADEAAEIEARAEKDRVLEENRKAIKKMREK